MENDLSPIQIGSLLAFVAAFLGTRLLIKAHLNDAPDDDRKLHIEHKATSGGIAIFLGFAAAAIYFLINTNFISDMAIYVLLGLGIGFAALGLIDDILTVHSGTRLFIMGLLACLIALSPYRVENLNLGFGNILPLGIIIGGLGSAFWVILMVNAVNFMDGVNGISLGSMAISSIGLGIISYFHGDLEIAVLSLALSAAAMGFLVYNVVKGNIFAGDIGSWFMGFAYSALGLMAVRIGVSPFAVAICAAPVICEVLLTILYRISIKENIIVPHRLHLYQLLVKKGKSHLQTAAIWWGMSFAAIIIAMIIDRFAQNYMAIAFAVLVLIYATGAKILRPKLQ